MAYLTFTLLPSPGVYFLPTMHVNEANLVDRVLFRSSVSLVFFCVLIYCSASYLVKDSEVSNHNYEFISSFISVGFYYIVTETLFLGAYRFRLIMCC